MEYVFDAEGSSEILKTKGGRHSNLKGYHEIERVFPDQIITDSFFVVGRIRQEEDSEGYCYDWYEITRHYRTTDRFTPYKEGIEEGIAETQDALCEESEYLETRLADIEDALCEITEG